MNTSSSLSYIIAIRSSHKACFKIPDEHGRVLENTTNILFSEDRVPLLLLYYRAILCCVVIKHRRSRSVFACSTTCVGVERVHHHRHSKSTPDQTNGVCTNEEFPTLIHTIDHKPSGYRANAIYVSHRTTETPR